MKQPSRAVRCVTSGLSVLAMLACAGGQPPSASKPAPVASVAAAPAAAVAEPAPQPLAKPCQILQAHNEEELIAATERARSLMSSLLPTALADEAARLAADARRLAEREVPFGSQGTVKLKSLSRDQLEMATRANPGGDPGAYYRVLYLAERVEAVRRAFQRHEPLPTDINDPVPEFCAEDEHGAWGFWIERASFVLGSASDPADFRLGAQFALARVQRDGQAFVSRTWPSFYASIYGDERFLPKPEPNCCVNNYGQGAPNVVLKHDQDGDGILEVGLVASFGVEGSHQESAVLYRFRNGAIEEQPSTFDDVVDADADGRPDLLFDQRSEYGESCDSGFPLSQTSPRYLGHALPDGTYSLDDEVALAYSRTICPKPPARARTVEDIWCARLWGVDEAALRRQVLAGCAKQECPPTERMPCTHLESMLAELRPPFRLTPR